MATVIENFDNWFIGLESNNQIVLIKHLRKRFSLQLLEEGFNSGPTVKMQKGLNSGPSVQQSRFTTICPKCGANF